MRIFKNKPFARFVRKAGLDAAELQKGDRCNRPGPGGCRPCGGVIKQRVARPGGGKSGGFRTIILLKAGERAFFVRGFAKNELDNIPDDELAALKILAAHLLAYDDAAIGLALGAGILIEVTSDGKAIP